MAGKIGGAASFGGSPLPTVAGVDSDVNSEINVTPMIDVMLVLLIIFMVVTPALAGYVAVLPKARTAAPEKEDRVTLGIDTEGRYFIEDMPNPGPIPPGQLAERLRQAYSTRSPDDHVLYMKADNGVGYDKVLTAIDAAREAGVARIGAITELPKGGAAAANAQRR
ncbi:MAG TPA: biopolymer transporter ExbD [Longimicrobiaceae bacterium]|nr:biopolymer transporter ExbD [Longimicrobiaceae bacterium]